MSITPAFLDQLRDKLSLYEVVGRRVQWDRKKSNPRRQDWWACCPFHHEKTPSFHVEETKGRYHCFGCHESGDAISFVMATQNLTFPEAVEMLAQEAGMDMPRQSPQDRQRAETRKSLYEVMDQAAAFYRDQLQSRDGASALDYLTGQRQLSPEIITEFGLGYAPSSRTALFSHLKSHNIEVDQMVEAGLVIRPDDRGTPYDRFRERVIFPIDDSRGRVIAFGGRDLGGRARAKYLNSPETPLFHKGQVLYNLVRARGAAVDAGSVIVTEGYMDVIALAQAGFKHATAPLGTAVTEDQVRLLWRLAAEPILCFDGDEAGQRAAYRTLDLVLPLLEPGKSLGFSLLPAGRDPDDVIREDGAGAFRNLIETAQPLAEMLWRREVEAGPTDTPERRAGLKSRLRELVATIRDRDVRGLYGEEIRRRIDGLFSWNAHPGGPQTRSANQPWKTQNRGRNKLAHGSDASSSLKQSSQVGEHNNTRRVRAAYLLAPLIKFPELLDSVEEQLSEIGFESTEYTALRDALLEIHLLNTQIDNTGGPVSSLDEAGVLRHLEAKRMRETAMRILALASSLGVKLTRGEAVVDEALESWRHTAAWFQQSTMLSADIIKAEAILAADTSDENSNRLEALKAQMKSLDTEDAK